MTSIRSLVAAAALAPTLLAQAPAFLPDARYDPDLPTMEAVLGHACGERISSHSETLAYARALAAASPNVELLPYGESWEGRELVLLVVSSASNLARLSDVRLGMARLADPRKLTVADQDRLLDDLPAVTWLAYSVHGNEISCTDAALFTAYHLAAARQSDRVDTILRETVVIINPLQNPDGRERFVFHYRQTRGRWADAEPAAAERDEPWPGGRSNHYLFDMNRDWFAMTQPETRARVAAFLQWWPVVFVDLHEMGTNSTYFFGPPATPLNPEITTAQREWLERYGRNNAQWFDQLGFDYFTRESFDAFYPGYGEGWPMFHGAVGMTYEQASVRGLIVERNDETTVHYRDSVRRHFVASLATAETTADNRRAALARFVEDRRSAVEEGRAGPVVEFVLPPGRDAGRTTKLAHLLARQGIEVHTATEGINNAGVRSLDGDGEVVARAFPHGTFVVKLDQPAKRLATVLLTRHQDMEPEFLDEQRAKHDKRESTQFYDLTGWSLPLLFGVDCFEATASSTGELVLVEPGPPGPPGVDPEKFTQPARAQVAYVIPSGRNDTARALAELLRRDLRVHCADKAFRIGDRQFERGSLIVKVHDNPESLHSVIHAVDDAYGLDVFAADSGWVDDGIHFGSNRVRFCEKPKVLMVYDRPTSSYSAGAARYLLEQSYGYPVTIVRGRRLGSADLSRFNVLVMPDGGGYGAVIEKSTAERIARWVRDGGTLVTLGGGATRWLTSADVGLLSTEPEKRAKPDDEPADEVAAKPAATDGEADPDAVAAEPATTDFDYERAIQPDDESPARTPGAILRVALDPDHWVAFGLSAEVNVVSRRSEIYTPVKLDKGRNVGVFVERDRLLRSGFAWEDKLDQLARKAWLVHQPHGRGHVVAFAEDPNLRAMVDGTNLLFLNAVLLGPAH